MLTRFPRLALSGAALAVGALAGCGPQGVSNVAVEIAAPAASFFSSSDTLHSSLSGTADQVARAETLEQQGEQRDYSTCMLKSGFQYDVPVVDWVHPQPKVYAPSWWANPSMADAELGIGYAPAYEPDSGSAGTGGSTSYESLSEAQKGAYDAALANCAQSASVDAGAAGAQLKRALAVQTSLDDALRAATSTKEFEPTRNAYSTCMADAGITVAEPGKLYDIAEEAVVKTGIQAHDIRSPEYLALRPKAIAAEVEIARADVTCRAQVADAIASTLSPALDSWLAANKAQVDKVTKGWSAFAP